MQIKNLNNWKKTQEKLISVIYLISWIHDGYLKPIFIYYYIWILNASPKTSLFTSSSESMIISIKNQPTLSSPRLNSNSICSLKEPKPKDKLTTLLKILRNISPKENSYFPSLIRASKSIDKVGIQSLLSPFHCISLNSSNIMELKPSWNHFVGSEDLLSIYVMVSSNTMWMISMRRR